MLQFSQTFFSLFVSLFKSTQNHTWLHLINLRPKEKNTRYSEKRCLFLYMKFQTTHLNLYTQTTYNMTVPNFDGRFHWTNNYEVPCDHNKIILS